MKRVKVSIIIPVFNSEKFINRCMESVLNQTMEDIEIIVVNDGSTDRSFEILTKLEEEFDHIILLNQENSGQAIARNRAIQQATGDYLVFVDSDDFIERNMVEQMYSEAIKNKVDIVICNWNRVDVTGDVIENKDHSEYDHKIMTREEILRLFLCHDHELVEGFSFNKLIKRSILVENQITYPNMAYEDIPMIFSILTKINTCLYLNQILYHYVQHHDSITHTKSIRNIEDFAMAIKGVKEILIQERLYEQFEDEYDYYCSKKLLSEYSSAVHVIRSSRDLIHVFESLLKPISLKKIYYLHPYRETRLFIKLLLYKIKLLPLLIHIYRNFNIQQRT
ncbi:glycosyltransferase [Robertmurraya massiliosenegalensis]|uniref:glycosyltransferase n=1 Tax=Robertmurraya TaxID=2837507 RepID=UPI0039A6AA15